MRRDAGGLEGGLRQETRPQNSARPARPGADGVDAVITREEWHRRENAAYDRLYELRGCELTDAEIIDAVADYLVAQHSRRRPYRVHLAILDMTPDREVEFDWKVKNVRGISTTDHERAKAWVRQCMRLGYGVFYQNRKGGSGFGRGTLAEIRQRGL